MPEDLLRVGSPEWLGRRCSRVAGYGEFGPGLDLAGRVRAIS